MHAQFVQCTFRSGRLHQALHLIVELSLLSMGTHALFESVCTRSMFFASQ